MAKPKIAITMGDPAGVGPEVALGALAAMDCSGFEPLLIGDADVAARYQTGNSVMVPLLHLASSERFVPGEGTVASAKASLRYIDEAIRLWKKREIDAIITGPVHKGNIEKSGTKFMGHTEYFAAAIQGPEPFMMMYSEEFSVILVTTHYPVSALAGLVNRDSILRTIKTGDAALRRIRGRAPRIAVAGFDPHCGDGGAIGTFDAEVTAPLIKELQEQGLDVHGPYSADTLFMPARWKTFDLVVAHYHDQGLIPFKMLAFENGVNVTLGLDLVRTSVDHGTAFDIAGKGLADSRSMQAAINLACFLCS